jgi:hypothetical protein
LIPAASSSWEDLAGDGTAPLGSIAPRDAADLAGIIQRLSLLPSPPAVVATGGRTSYSGAYLVDRPDHLLIEMHRFDSLETAEGFAVAGAGLSWVEICQRLAQQGLRPLLPLPSSMRFATVGGGASTDAVGIGAARYGTLAGHISGLELVTGAGEIVQTGTIGNDGAAFGEGKDRWRAALGDCGLLGMKTRIAFPVGPFGSPRTDHAFVCDSEEDQEAALVRLTEAGCCDDVIALDVPATGLRLLEFSVVEGRVATDRPWPAGKNTSSVSQTAPSILPALYGPPGPWLDMLAGPAGTHWLPVHAIMPTDRYRAAMAAVRGLFKDRLPQMAETGLGWAFTTMAVGRDRLLIEANLYLPGRARALLGRFLPREQVEALQAQPSCPATERLARQIRRDFILAAAPFGARHMQIGRLYPFRPIAEDMTLRAMEEIRERLDPRHLLNPGVLGIG